MVEFVRVERDQLLSQLAEREQDLVELNQARTCLMKFEQSGKQLQQERDVALEQLAQLKGQYDIIYSQYQEAKDSNHKLKEDLHSQSGGVETSVLKRLCSETSAMFEIEKANHMDTKFELNELRAKHERVCRELEQLQEMKDNMTTDIEELRGSLRKSEAENRFQRTTKSLKGGFDSLTLSRTPSSKHLASKLQQQVALLKWQNHQYQVQLEEANVESVRVNEQYNVSLDFLCVLRECGVYTICENMCKLLQ